MPNQLRIVANFKTIRDHAARKPAAFADLQGQEAVDLWNDAAEIRKIAKHILSLLNATPEEDADVQDGWKLCGGWHLEFTDTTNLRGISV